MHKRLSITIPSRRRSANNDNTNPGTPRNRDQRVEIKTNIPDKFDKNVYEDNVDTHMKNCTNSENITTIPQVFKFCECHILQSYNNVFPERCFKRHVVPDVYLRNPGLYGHGIPKMEQHYKHAKKNRREK